MDTSFLITLDAYYSKSSPIFLPVWEDMEGLVSGGLVKTVEFVRGEIQDYAGKYSFLKNWFEECEAALLEPMTEEIWNLADRVVKQHPELLKPQKQSEGKTEADPFLIALAQVNGATILTQESKEKPSKIPKVAAHYGVESFDIMDFLQERGFKFVKT